MKKKTYVSHYNEYRIEVSIKPTRCPVSKHPIACVLGHVPTQIAGVAEAGVAIQTHAGLLPGVNPHVDLQVGALTKAPHALVTPIGLLPRVNPHVELQVVALLEALHALVTPVGLLAGVSPHVQLQVSFLLEAHCALVTPIRLFASVGTHVDDHLGIVGKNLATQDTGPVLAATLRPSQLLTVDQPLATIQALGHTVIRR